MKLASRGTSMKKLSEIIEEIDRNSDGKLTLEEVKAIAKKAHQKKSSTKRSLKLSIGAGETPAYPAPSQ